MVVSGGHTSPSPLRSFASVIAQMVDAVPTDVRERVEIPRSLTPAWATAAFTVAGPALPVQAVA
jgi:hypothetical protein